MTLGVEFALEWSLDWRDGAVYPEGVVVYDEVVAEWGHWQYLAGVCRCER